MPETASRSPRRRCAGSRRPSSGGELERLVAGSGVNVNLRLRQEEGDTFSRELVARDFTDVVEHEAWTGPGTLELRANAQAPVYLLPVREVVLALHRVVDLTLAPGRVVHRY